MFSLKGRTALITGVGAADGIGFATAKALAQLGAKIIITSTTERVFDRAFELQAQGHGVTAHTADLTDSAAVAAMYRHIDQLDILVNNAGMQSVLKPLTEGEATDLTAISDEAWATGVARNLDTAFKATRAALPLLRVSNAGRIIMVSSVTGGLMAMQNQPAYAASKAGLIGLAKSLAIDEAQYGITSNSVLPGWIGTAAQPSHEAKQGLHTPMRRTGTAAEVASAIAWLATTEASYITGQAIIVDGGNSVAEERAV